MAMNFADKGPWYSLRAVDGKGRERDFAFEMREGDFLENGRPYWDVFLIPSEDYQSLTDLYFAKIVRIDNQTVWSKVVANNLPAEYHHCGITPALYLAIAALLNAKLLSSSVSPNGDDFLSVDAVHVWRGLQERGQAVYDPAIGRFCIDGTGRPKPEQTVII